MRRDCLCLLAAALTLTAGCGSDPEAPVTRPFVESDWYSPDPGETVRFVDTLSALATLDVPMGVGRSSLLKLGEVERVRYSAVLMEFDFDSIGNYAGRTVDSVLIDLPVVTVQDTLFHLGITFNELLEGFEEDDTITAVPAFDPVPLTGPSGETERDINIERTAFALATGPVQGWIDGSSDPWPYGIAVNWSREPDTLGLIEMNAQDRGTDPPVLRVRFDDGTEAVFPVISDYSITSYTGDGPAVVGGVARRVFFEFGLEGVPDEAMLHYSALVVSVDASESFGATVGELLLGVSNEFFYYLYSPDSADPGSSGILEGTGVATGSFSPAVDSTIRIPLRQYMVDVLSGRRANTGLVLQSDLEAVRVQKAGLFSVSAGDSLRPYVEIVYSLPADFGGER